MYVLTGTYSIYFIEEGVHSIFWLFYKATQKKMIQVPSEDDECSVIMLFKNKKFVLLIAAYAPLKILDITFIGRL